MPDQYTNGPGEQPGWERSVLEKVALASIREQRAARRWRIFFRLVYLLIAIIIIGMLFGHSGGGAQFASKPGRHTALVSLNGEISASSSASAENVNDALDAAFADANTVGVVLECNSPGGSPVQAGMIYNEIKRLRLKYPATPLYVVVDDMCASGGYYVAAAADRIYVDRASVVGSIGVLMESFGFTGLMDKLGIERRLHTSGENKGFFDPFSPETDKMKAHAQQMLDQIHAQFIAAVKQGRGSRLKESPDLFSGLFWSGQQSVDLGLADGFGDTHYVAREVIKADRLVDYTVKNSLANRLAQRFGTAIGGGAVAALVKTGVLQLQ